MLIYLLLISSSILIYLYKYGRIITFKVVLLLKVAESYYENFQLLLFDYDSSYPIIKIVCCG